MCMVDDGEGWDYGLFSEGRRKARKPHRCGECNRMILTGETYRYWQGRYDGYWSSGKMCAHCDVVTKWLDVVCSGYLFNAIQEDLEEHVVGDERYVRSAPLTRLVRWMRADWRDRAGELRPVEAVTDVTQRAIDAYRRQVAAA